MSMFFKGSRESVLLPVEAKVLRDGGSETVIGFRARYRCVSEAERAAFRQRLAPDGDVDKVGVLEEIARSTTIGWEKVTDNDDKPIEFGDEAFAEAMNFPPYRDALIEGALKAMFGKDYDRAKNSVRRGAGG